METRSIALWIARTIFRGTFVFGIAGATFVGIRSALLKLKGPTEVASVSQPNSLHPLQVINTDIPDYLFTGLKNVPANPSLAPCNTNKLIPARREDVALTTPTIAGDDISFSVSAAASPDQAPGMLTPFVPDIQAGGSKNATPQAASVSQLPEPGMLSLAAIGFGGMLFHRKRRTAL